MTRRLCLASIFFAALAPGALAQAPSAPRVVVGPNILVSRDGDFPHVELHVSANPKRAKNLVGGAITATRPEGGWACRAYASTDGGSSWRASDFPEQVEFGGGDPYTAFTPQGTAIFSALTFKKDENGLQRGFLHVYRSEDGGRSWGNAMELGYSYDHEQIIVDQSAGKYAGRIYIGVLHGYPIYTVGVFRSEDDGRTWIGPAEAANGGGKVGINDVTPMVLSDGTLVMPYGDFQFLPEKRKSKGRVEGTFWTVLSNDGGITFSAPRKVVSQQFNFDDEKTKLAGFGKFAADTESKKYLDRMYFAWEDSRLGPYRILFAYSADRGKTWSPPRPLDDAIPKSAKQFQPAIAVNKEGVVGVTWFDTRDSADGSQYHEYFAASADGGQTFLPSTRISSAPSNPIGPGNSQISPLIFKGKEMGLSMSFLSAAYRWGSGGDYMGLAADKNGAFHPFWADSRSGTFQIYTAEVRVDLPPDKPDSKAPGSTAKPAEPAPRVESSLEDSVEFIFDPTRYDWEKKQVEIPVRMKNVSTQRIYPPIRLEILGFGFPQFESEDDKKRNAENAPTALNPSNGKPKEGAVFEFGGALGTAEALEPGAQTNPVVLRFQFVDPEKVPSLRLKAVGMVSAAR